MWIETQEMIDKGQEILQSAFGQDEYIVRHSRVVCDYRNCTGGNHMIIDNIQRNFKRYIDVKYKRVYWCFVLREFIN